MCLWQDWGEKFLCRLAPLISREKYIHKLRNILWRHCGCKKLLYVVQENSLNFSSEIALKNLITNKIYLPPRGIIKNINVIHCIKRRFRHISTIAKEYKNFNFTAKYEFLQINANKKRKRYAKFWSQCKRDFHDWFSNQCVSFFGGK